MAEVPANYSWISTRFGKAMKTHEQLSRGFGRALVGARDHRAEELTG